MNVGRTTLQAAGAHVVTWAIYTERFFFFTFN